MDVLRKDALVMMSAVTGTTVQLEAIARGIVTGSDAFYSTQFKAAFPVNGLRLTDGWSVTNHLEALLLVAFSAPHALTASDGWTSSDGHLFTRV